MTRAKDISKIITAPAFGGLTYPTSDGSNGQVIQTNGSGTLSFTTITGTTINNNADNRIITGSGSANTLEAEANLTFDGSTLDLGDNIQARFGASQDMQIFHDGSDSKIVESGTGNLILQSDGTEVRIMNGSEFTGRFQNNDAVKLFFDNSKKFETVTGGVTVTGTCTATTFSGSGASLTNLPASGTFRTAVASAVQSGAISIGTNSTTISAVSVTVADANDRVVVFAPTHLDTQSSSTSGQGLISIFRGSTNLGNNAFLAESARLRWFNMLMAHDTPGAGTHTYSVQASKSNGSVTANGGGAYSYIIAFVETV